MSLIRTFLRRGMVLTTAIALVALMAACSSPAESTDASDGGGNAGGGTVAVTAGAVELSADDLAFDANVIQATAGEAFTITFTNNEAAQHNISVYTEEGGEEIVIGDVIGEGETVEVQVPALDAGEYFFVCDIHPDIMMGSVVVEG
ncbi:MAG: cupredoxin domain-containing protein [Chloroflexota bacterium]|nr:cupredoxin domain-containing protein [Chloroflexota bacterium]